jgi:SNF2 family DNA or RNA helicase
MPHADVIEDRIFVQTEWNERDLVKQIPGARWHTERKLWHVPLTWVACLQLRGVFKERLTVGGKLIEWSTGVSLDRIEPAQRLRGLSRPDFYDERDPLRAFQRAGVDFMSVAGSCLLGDDTGLGKTVQMLEMFSILRDGFPALVICPKSLKINWAREAKTWSSRANTYVISGGAVQRHRQLVEASKDRNALVMVSYDTLRSHSRLAPYGSIRLRRCRECGGTGEHEVPASRCEVHPGELNWMPFKTVVLDEAHRIKDPASKQTRAAWAVGHMDHVERRFALTGTPIGDAVDDLWSVMHFLAPDEHPVRSTFVERYALTSWGTYGGVEISGLNPDTRQEFYRVIEPRFRRMPKALVLDQLPPVVRSRRYVELSPKQRKAYNDIAYGKENGYALVTKLPDGNLLVAPNDLEAQLRLMQFSSATMKQIGVDEKTGKPKFEMCEPSSKIDALEEFIGEYGNRQLAVCAEHRQLINLAAHRLDKIGIKYSLVVGGQRDFERDSALRQAVRGDVQVLLFTIRAGGEGLTMTFTDTLVFIQRSWSMLANLQTEGRISRIGAEKHDSLNYVDFIADTEAEMTQLSRLYQRLERLDEITRDRETLRAAGHDIHELDAEEKKILSGNLGVL